MDFNLDDPLGDILSDGSNESFFETGPPKKTSTPQKPGSSSKLGTTVGASAKKGNVENLFGITDIQQSASMTNKTEIDAKPASVFQSTKRSEPIKSKTVMQKDDVAFNDDDLLSDLGFDPKKPKTSKSNILDDLLGPIEPKKSTMMTPSRPQTAGGMQKEDAKPISRQSTETTESTVPGTYTASASLPKSKTAIRRQSAASTNDPLGLFGPLSSTIRDKDVAESKEFRETPKSRRKGTTADWLGVEPGSKTSLKSASRPTSPAPPPYQKEQSPQILSIPEPQAVGSYILPPTSTAAQGTLLVTAAALETQNAMQVLQQQEVQLEMASQLKNQEVALQEMQKRQQNLLAQQEAQFNRLLQQQLARQGQLEMTIRSQQERINSHIQLLMAQTGNIDAKSASTEPPAQNESAEAKPDLVQLKADVRALELEKLRIEDLLSNINSNHEKEIEFMENSHKKQIIVLENNIQSMETRFQKEIKSLEDFYQKKIEMIESEKTTKIANYERKLNEIQEEHESTLKKIKLNHEDSINSLKEDYKNMIVNIRQSKLLEFSAVQENNSYLDTLRVASNHLEDVSGDLRTLKDDMYQKIDLAHKEREQKLEIREKKLEDNERHLKLIEEAAGEEKARLMDLVTTLEAQLSKSMREASEEQWAMRQKLAIFEAERSAFDREKQYAREQLARDDKRIEELKQFQLGEYQRLMQQIEEEKQLLITEKAKMETAKRLENSRSKVQSAQAELEAALKVAQDAAKQADQERDRFFKLQRELEAKKREIIDRENGLRQKQDELESSIVATKTKERKLEAELQKHRLTEQHFRAKVQLLHAQLQQIAERESNLSQDRLSLSQERLELQEAKRKLENNKCSLCKIGERTTDISRIFNEGSKDEGNVPVTHVLNFSENSVMHNNKDNSLLDQEFYDSLKKINNTTGNENVSADFDGGGIRYLDPTYNPNVPTTLLDSEIQNLNFYIHRNFMDE